MANYDAMTSETEKYRLSLYRSREIIKTTPDCRVETVFCTLDEKTYTMRTYPEDKRGLFHALAKIECGHIPRIAEVIFNESTVVIEECISGISLREMLEKSKIAQKRAHNLSTQIFTALCALQAGNIVHRDIKPDNILIDENDNLWLIDFGIARLYDEKARHDTQHFGTIGYAPPEQFGFRQTDFRSDIYAAGITIEELGKAAGCRPNSSVMKTASKCCEFDPNRRYAAAVDALSDLKKKNRFPPLAIAATFAALALFFALYAFKAHESASPHEEADLTESIATEISTAPPIPIETEEIIAPDRNTAPDDGDVSLPSPPIQDLDELIWVSIIENYSSQDTITLAIPDGSADAKGITLSRGREDINVSYTLSEGILTVELSDHHMPMQEFVFSHEPSERPDYANTKVEAEIIFIDMDGDGQLDILVILSDRTILQGPQGHVLCNTNWRAAWCVGYTPGEGFWQADGMTETYTNQGTIMLDYFGGGELYSNYEIARLIGRELR